EEGEDVANLPRAGGGGGPRSGGGGVGTVAAPPTPAGKSGGPSPVWGGMGGKLAQAPLSSPGTGEVAARSADGRRAGAAQDGDRLLPPRLAGGLATARGIVLAGVRGSGPHGRIVKSDVETAHPGAVRAPAPPAAPGTAPVAPAMTDAAIAKLYAPGTYDV